MRIDRRDFLRMSGLAGMAIGLPSGLEAWLAARGRDQDAGPGGGPTLVLVELTGGNDGLNTLVPFRDDLYHRARPTLRIAPSAVHRIDESLGFAPSLPKLAALFREGELLVAQGAGMPNPDRSHFTSLDRWHTGRLDEVPREEGWLAHGLGGTAAFAGVALGERVMPRVLQHSGKPSLCCETLEEIVPPEKIRKALASDALARLDEAAGSPEERRLAAAARELLASLDSVLRRPVDADAFPGSHLGRLFGDAFRLVISGLGVPAIFVRQGGFDTHVRQADVQPRLLSDLDGGLAAFAAAVKKRGLEKRVLVIVYSEFGRRVAENGSRGTDHGSGAPVFLWGGGLGGRLLGERPDLAKLDDGDVRATLDFRRVLAQGLRHLGAEPGAAFGPGFSALV